MALRPEPEALAEVHAAELGDFLSGPSPKPSLSGFTSETRAAPPRGAVISLQREGVAPYIRQTTASIRFSRYLSQIHPDEPGAQTAPHGGSAREMEDHRLPQGGRFEMSKLQA